MLLFFQFNLSICQNLLLIFFFEKLGLIILIKGHYLHRKWENLALLEEVKVMNQMICLFKFFTQKGFYLPNKYYFILALVINRLEFLVLM